MTRGSTLRRYFSSSSCLLPHSLNLFSSPFFLFFHSHLFLYFIFLISLLNTQFFFRHYHYIPVFSSLQKKKKKKISNDVVKINLEVKNYYFFYFLKERYSNALITVVSISVARWKIKKKKWMKKKKKNEIKKYVKIKKEEKKKKSLRKGRPVCRPSPWWLYIFNTLTHLPTHIHSQ